MKIGRLNCNILAELNVLHIINSLQIPIKTFTEQISKGWSKKTPMEGPYPAGPGLSCGQLALTRQSKNPKNENIKNQGNNLIKLKLIIRERN